MSTNSTMRNKSTLPLKTVYGYAAGEFGFTFFLIFIAYYLMYFLTDVLKFSPTKAAIIFTLCQWFEVMTVLISGVVINHSKTSYRKWMLRGAILCGIFTTLMFTKFSIPNQIYVYIFSIAYLIAYWGYNMMWISYRSLMGTIGKIPYDTVALSTTGFQLGTIAALLFSYLGIRALTTYAGNPFIYGINSFAYCIIMVTCIIIVYKIAKPYDKKENKKVVNKKRATIKELFYIFRGPMIPLFISIALRSAVSVMISALMIYYLRYILDDVTIMATYVLIISIAAFFGALAAKIITKYMDKKLLYIITGVINLILLLSLSIFGKSSIGFLIVMSLNAFFMILGNVLVPVFINDVSEFTKYKYKINIRAFTFSVGRLSIHASQIIGSSVASFGLVLFGYNSQETVSQTTINGIQYLMSYIPAILLFGGVGIFLFYKLDDKKMNIVQNEE